MRRTTSALTTTILGAVLAAPTVSAQQSPPARDVSTSAESDAGFGMAAARGARHLLRNGLDYIEYQEYDRALRYLREAERRQAELNEPERTKLKQAIDRAQRGTRESIGSEKPYAVSRRTLRSGGFAPAEAAEPAVAAKSDKARTPVATEGDDTAEPIRLAGAEAPAPPEGRSPSRIASAPSSLPEIPEAPAFDVAPAAEAPARDLAPALEPIDEATTAPPVVPIEAGADLPPSLPGLGPTPASDSAVARSRNVPGDAPEPDPSASSTIQLELPDEIAHEPAAAKAPTPPAPREAAPAAEPAPADEPEAPAFPDAAPLAPAAEPAPMALDDPALDLPALPAELTEAPADADPELPGLPAEVPTLPELPAEIPAESAPAPASQPAPELPAEMPAPAPLDDEEPASDRGPAAAPAPAPAEVGADLDVEAPAPAAEEPTQAPAAVEAPAPAPAPAAAPAPAPTRLPDLAPSPARPAASGLLPSRPAPTSTLSADLDRRVEEIAAAQEQAARDRLARQTPAALPEEGTDRPVDPTDDPVSDTRMQTQIDISRAPSPAEARPISAVPVPEDWVPLGAREWSPQRKYWAAAATCHLPLYFQDPMLERYGHSVENYLGPGGRFFTYPIDKPSQSTQRNQILQPAASVGQFAFQILTLPYALIVDPPWESQYDLGYWRPGDRIPTDMYYLPTHGTGPPLKGSKY